MERFFKAKGIHPDIGGGSFTFCTDGPHHLRLVLHPEACNKGIQLQSYFHSYFNLRKEFQKLYKRPATSIKDMLDCILSHRCISSLCCTAVSLSKKSFLTIYAIRGEATTHSRGLKVIYFFNCLSPLTNISLNHKTGKQPFGLLMLSM